MALEPKSVRRQCYSLSIAQFSLRVAPNGPNHLQHGEQSAAAGDLPMRHALKNTLRNAIAFGTALCGLAAMTPATAAETMNGPCFVAGDALGVELHVVAVLALATPAPDPMEFNAFPIELARVPVPSVQHALINYAPTGHAHVEPTAVTHTQTTSTNPWTLLADLANWLTVAPPSFGDDTLWIAIVD